MSLGGRTVTFQALQALEMTGGSTTTVDEDDVRRDQRALARAGLYLELSSAAALSGLRGLLRRETISSRARAVILATSHGYKETPGFDQPLGAARGR